MVSMRTLTAPLLFVLALFLSHVAAAGADGDGFANNNRPIGNVTEKRLLNANAEPSEWLTGGRDWRQSYYSPLTKINKGNVTQLGFAWSSAPIDLSRGFQSTPIVVDGHMFASGNRGDVYAVDARTGRILWTFKSRIDPNVVSCCGGANRGVAVWRGKVYVASLDAQLYALDAADGHIIWKADTVIDHRRSYSSSGAPYIAGKYVVIGQSGAEYDTRGYVSAYDLQTGKLGWRFFIVPGDPKIGFEHPELAIAANTWDPESRWDIGGGGAPWDGMAYDPELNLLYVGTGNGLPWSRALRSPKGGDNLFLSSIIALNADTGRLKWHYQTTPADNWDYNACQKMILADLSLGKRERKVLMQAPKNSFFYVLDRATGELISAEPYIYRNWASHVDMKTGRPVETAQADYSNQPKLIFPTDTGGHNWSPMSYNHTTGLVYIPTLLAGELYGTVQEPFQRKSRVWNHGVTYGPVEAFEIGALPFPQGWPSLEQLKAGWPDPAPRTFLMAWDPIRQKQVWSVETTSKKHSGQRSSPGVMSTAAGLVVQGSINGDLNIFDASTGEQLHQIAVGTGMAAAPMTYSIEGEQYIAIMAGSDIDDLGRIIAFKLGGGSVPQLPPSAEGVGAAGPPPLSDSRDLAQIKRGEGLFTATCAACHFTGGRAPDLTRMTIRAHREFFKIVRQGARAEKGMPNFGETLSDADARAIRAYLVHRGWERYRSESETSRKDMEAK